MPSRTRKATSLSTVLSPAMTSRTILLGVRVSQYTEDGVKISGHWNNVSPAAYVQDNWRVNKPLDIESGPAMGWHSAYLRSQPLVLQLLSQPVQLQQRGNV